MIACEVIVSGAKVLTRNAGKDAREQGPFDLQANGGEFLSLLGPRGSGKSTLIRLIAGLLPLSSGRVQLSGTSVHSPQTEIGIVFDRPLLMESRTAFENVMLQAEIRGLNRNSSADQARRLLAMIGFSGNENRMPRDLPFEMAVRVAICRALLHNPALLLLDDPFRGMDPLEREQIATDLQRLSLTPRTTVLLATCLPIEAVQLSDRVAVVSPDGSVRQYLSIDLPRPRRLDRATTPKIMDYCSSVRTLLQAQGTLR